MSRKYVILDKNSPILELHIKMMIFLKERKKKKLFRPGRPRIPGRILVKAIDKIDDKKEGGL